jgi:hypothetical protein
MDKNKRRNSQGRLIIKNLKESNSRGPDDMDSPKSIPKLASSSIKLKELQTNPNINQSPGLLTTTSHNLSPSSLPGTSGQVLAFNQKTPTQGSIKKLPTVKEALMIKVRSQRTGLIQMNRFKFEKNDEKIREKFKSTSPHFLEIPNYPPDWLKGSCQDHMLDSSIKLSPVENKQINDDLSDIKFLAKTLCIRLNTPPPDVFTETYQKPNQMPILKPTSPIFVLRRRGFRYFNEE